MYKIYTNIYTIIYNKIYYNLNKTYILLYDYLHILVTGLILLYNAGSTGLYNAGCRVEKSKSPKHAVAVLIPEFLELSIGVLAPGAIVAVAVVPTNKLCRECHVMGLLV